MSNFARFELGDGAGAIVAPPIAPFKPTHVGRWMSFDPSLTAAGWVCFSTGGERVNWIASGVIQPGGDAKTQLGKAACAYHVHMATKKLLEEHTGLSGVILEFPSSPRPGMTYSDAPVVAFAAVIAAVMEMAPEVQVRGIVANKAKARWTGDKKASKAQVRKAMLATFPEMSTELTTLVEAVFDAACVGVTALDANSKEG